MIPGGWNCQRDVSNIQHDPGPVEGALEKRMIITGGWNSQKEPQESTNNTHEKPSQGDYITLCSV